MPFIQEMMQRQ